MPRKHKRRKKKATQFATEKSTDSDGINIYAMVAGLVTTLMLILLAWSQWATPRETAIALAQAKDTDQAADVVNTSKQSVFEEVLKRGTTKDLYNILIGYDELKEQELGVAAQIIANRRRIEVANEMLEKALSEQQRELAIISKLEAMTVIHDLNHRYHLEEPSVIQSLRKTAETYRNDAVKRVALTARLSLFRLNTVELPDGTSHSIPLAIVNEFAELNRDFPGDRLVLATIRLTVNYYFNSFDPDAGVAFVQSLREQIDVTESPQLAEAFNDFSDMALLVESGLNQAYTNRWVNGTAGQRELVDLSLQLASNPESGPGVIVSLDLIASWLEQIDQYELAAPIYQTMLDHSETFRGRKAIALAKQSAENGIRRTQLIGKKLIIAGTKPNGEPINPDDFKDKVLVVIFWSCADPGSVTTIQQVLEESGSWRKRAVQLMAVCIDPTHGEAFKSIAPTLRGYHLVIADVNDNGKNPIFDQCPSTRVPRAMLVGRDGIVADTSVPFTELNTQIEMLLTPKRTEK